VLPRDMTALDAKGRRNKNTRQSALFATPLDEEF